MRLESGVVIGTEKAARYDVVIHEVPLADDEGELEVLRQCNERITHDEHGGAYLLKLKDIGFNQDKIKVAIIDEIAIKSAI